MQQQTIVRTQIPGVTVVRSPAGAAAEIAALRATRQALTSELDRLESQRSSIMQRVQQLTGGPEREALDARAGEVTQQIAQVERTLASTNGKLEALGAGIRENVVVVPGGVGAGGGRSGPSTGTYVANAVAAMVVLFPLSVALAIRLVRRGARPAPAVPSDVAERLTRLEQAIESSAIEIERIGEGQRYLTRVLSSQREPVA